jgi:DnaK suppressor protein
MAKNTQKPSSAEKKGSTSKASSSKAKTAAAKKTASAPASKTVTKASAKKAEAKPTKKAAESKPAKSAPVAAKKAAPAPEPKPAPKAAAPVKPAAPAPAPAKPAAPAPAPAKSAPPAAAKKVPTGMSPKKMPKEIFSASTGTPTTDPFPPKELDRFRQLIQDIRVENVEELEALTEQLREMTSSDNLDDNSAYSLHMAEQGTDAMEREKTFLQAQRTSDYIKKLDESLRRIQDASFGLCRVCGLRLDSKRLMAVPVTQVCTYYKNTSKPCEPGRLQMEAMGITEDDN